MRTRSHPGTQPSGPAVDRVAERVRLSHAQARASLRLVLAFLAAAGVAGVAGAPRWVVVHLFLAGAVVQAIGGVSLMLTVTWSAAAAPSDGWARIQRWATAAGAAGVVVARGFDLPTPVLAAAGSTFLAGLALLAVLLVTTFRTGTEPRYGPAVAGYVAALVAAAVAGGLGIALASGATGVGGGDLRSAHLALNLLGFVGGVIAATLPFFASTVVRSKMAPVATPRRLTATVAAHVTAVWVTAAGFLAGSRPLAVAGLLGVAAAVAAVLGALPRPTLRQWRFAGPRLVALWAGGAWWVMTLLASAVDVAAGHPLLVGRWLGVLVAAGFGQVLWASLAYLLPMLRGGGHQRLADGFAATRSWVGLAAVNLAGATFALGAPARWTAAALTIWAVDAAWRAVRVGTTRAERPPSPLARTAARAA